MNPLGDAFPYEHRAGLEVHFGICCQALGWKVATPIFDGANEDDIMDTLRLAGLSADGKSILHDGRTGNQFDNPVTVGYVYAESSTIW